MKREKEEKNDIMRRERFFNEKSQGRNVLVSNTKNEALLILKHFGSFWSWKFDFFKNFKIVTFERLKF